MDSLLVNAERAIRDAVAVCYAMEGYYPPDIEYIERKYGVLINRKRYIYIYDAPDIRVTFR
jgi:hypothetical protein